MAEEYSIGVASIKMGAIAGDGGMGLTLTDIGGVYQDTAEIIQDDPSETDHFVEQSDDPILTVIKKGKTTLKFAVVDMAPATLEKFIGGTVTAGAPDTLGVPDVFPSIEKSMEITTTTGQVIQIIRAKIYGKLSWNLSKTNIAKCEITAKVLKPTKTATASIIIKGLS